MREDFYDKLDKYVALVTEITDANFARHYPNIDKPFFTVNPKGKRYAKIVQNEIHGTSRSVHSFVDMENGSVFYAAGWAAPAKKTPRGNIFDEDNGRSALTSEGYVRMLRGGRG
jgi:hypothetical protein